MKRLPIVNVYILLTAPLPLVRPSLFQIVRPFPTLAVTALLLDGDKSGVRVGQESSPSSIPSFGVFDVLQKDLTL